MATIFAWSGALRKRGELDRIHGLCRFADALESACFETLNSGIMTKDLVGLVDGEFANKVRAADSEEFIKAIRSNIRL